MLFCYFSCLLKFFIHLRFIYQFLFVVKADEKGNINMLTATAIVGLNEPHTQKKTISKEKKRKTILQTKSKKKQTMSIKKWNKDHRQTLCLIPTSN